MLSPQRLPDRPLDPSTTLPTIDPTNLILRMSPAPFRIGVPLSAISLEDVPPYLGTVLATRRDVSSILVVLEAILYSVRSDSAETVRSSIRTAHKLSTDTTARIYRVKVRMGRPASISSVTIRLFRLPSARGQYQTCIDVHVIGYEHLLHRVIERCVEYCDAVRVPVLPPDMVNETAVHSTRNVACIR